jgi:flavodoxin
MKTLVIHDSLYGNTEKIAKAIGDAIPGDVQVLPVGQVSAADLETVDLLFFRLSNPRSLAHGGGAGPAGEDWLTGP